MSNGMNDIIEFPNSVFGWVKRHVAEKFPDMVKRRTIPAIYKERTRADRKTETVRRPTGRWLAFEKEYFQSEGYVWNNQVGWKSKETSERDADFEDEVARDAAQTYQAKKIEEVRLPYKDSDAPL